MDCDRGGNYKKKNEVATPFDGNYTMRLRCPFRLRFVSSGIGWKVVVKCGMHNHRLDKDMLGHDILGRLKDDERSTIWHQGKRDALTEMQKLLSLIYQEKYMCWSRNKENSDIVADIFWTHPDSVKLLNMFLLVLLFDCTYKTNRYRLPLPEIVGVTSTKLTFSVAFAYLEHERDKTSHGVESAHWRLKNMLNISRGDLCASWEAVNTMLKLQLEYEGKEKWMMIPDMGYPIASKYSVVFVSISMLMNITFFPLLIAPPPYTSRHTIIVIGFVNHNHWVQVKLRPVCPLPPITDRWRKNYSDNAKTWESAYAGRLRHWKELSRNPDIGNNCSNDAKNVVLL
ncbi:uncharacterized protein LOC131635808 [Vicia villosa]|uniref:uncharacterized protein LOC131635808 n=1 Tax=Vicia villosa TaxID=3911 RepID=UPI00273CEC2A|nr:uncharacterized protein LOC131635808 [Vicia villosa]